MHHLLNNLFSAAELEVTRPATENALYLPAAQKKTIMSRWTIKRDESGRMQLSIKWSVPTE